MAYRSKLGMGTYNVVDPNTGQVIDCDSWGNFFNLTCWGGNSITGAGTGPYSNQVVPSGGASPGTVSDASTYDASVTGTQGITPSSIFNLNPIALAAIGFGVAALFFGMMGRR